MNLLLNRQWWPGMAGSEESGWKIDFSVHFTKVLASEPTGQQWYCNPKGTRVCPQGTFIYTISSIKAQYHSPTASPKGKGRLTSFSFSRYSLTAGNTTALGAYWRQAQDASAAGPSSWGTVLSSSFQDWDRAVPLKGLCWSRWRHSQLRSSLGSCCLVHFSLQQEWPK